MIDRDSVPKRILTIDLAAAIYRITKVEGQMFLNREYAAPLPPVNVARGVLDNKYESSMIERAIPRLPFTFVIGFRTEEFAGSVRDKIRGTDGRHGGRVDAVTFPRFPPKKRKT
jgi:hypothetical protein